jgi:glycosyltransferase involved in cell wall biosynthesis
MQSCRDRTPEIVAGLRRNDAVVTLDPTAAATVAELLGFGPDRVHVIGAGFREDLFHAGEGRREPGRELLYVGKLARAKGLHCLLEAFESLAARDPRLRLHVAGSGSGLEADRLRDRMRALAPRVRMYGQLDQPALADLMRAADVLVLPSFYEGLPLVLVEAAACGCRVVATDLPGVRRGLAPVLGEWLTTVGLPPMASVDEPEPDAVAGFVRRLADGIEASLGSAPAASPRLAELTWEAVFERVERVWHELIGAGEEGR